MKTSELESAELDYWVAKAQGWELIDFHGDGEMYWNDPHSTYIKRKCGYHPTTNWAQCGELLVKFNMSLTDLNGKGDWVAYQQGKTPGWAGATPQIAVCRAVVASVFGEDVSDENEK